MTTAVFLKLNSSVTGLVDGGLLVKSFVGEQNKYQIQN